MANVVVGKALEMPPSPRLSDKELAALNVAAVTKEYNVKPHLGTSHLLKASQHRLRRIVLFRLPDSLGS